MCKLPFIDVDFTIIISIHNATETHARETTHTMCWMPIYGWIFEHIGFLLGWNAICTHSTTYSCWTKEIFNIRWFYLFRFVSLKVSMCWRKTKKMVEKVHFPYSISFEFFIHSPSFISVPITFNAAKICCLNKNL